MLIGQVFHAAIKGQAMVEAITSAKINLLIRRSQVVVRQKQGIAEEGVRKKGAVVTTAHQVAAQRKRKFWLGVAYEKTPRVRRPPKWPVADQRRKCADGYGWKRRIERWKQIVAAERTLHHCIQVGICGPRA